MRQTTAPSALRESEETFRLLFSHNPLPMWLADVTTREFLEVNNAAVARHPAVGRDPAAHGAAGRHRALDG
jgi:hypothetical protein